MAAMLVQTSLMTFALGSHGTADVPSNPRARRCPPDPAARSPRYNWPTYDRNPQLRSTRSHFILRRLPSLTTLDTSASILDPTVWLPPSSRPSPPDSRPSPAENAARSSQSVLGSKRRRSRVPDRMATAAKNFFHGIGHNAAHPHLPRSNNKFTTKKEERNLDPEFQRRKEEEKALICSWDCDNKEPLSFDQICRPVSEKRLGHSTKSLERKDFKLIKTVGTGESGAMPPTSLG